MNINWKDWHLSKGTAADRKVRGSERDFEAAVVALSIFKQSL